MRVCVEVVCIIACVCKSSVYYCVCVWVCESSVYNCVCVCVRVKVVYVIAYVCLYGKVVYIMIHMQIVTMYMQRSCVGCDTGRGNHSNRANDNRPDITVMVD